jgi:hypothetical protein
MNPAYLKAASDALRAESGSHFEEGRTDLGLIAGARALLADAYLRRELCRSLQAPARQRPTATLSGLAPDPVRVVRRTPPALGQTTPGMPSPAAALEAAGEAPFPLVQVRRLPGAPRTPPPAHAAGSLFTRALTWTLKSWRA